MLLLLVTSLLAAATPGPRALPEAQTVIYVPHPDRLSALGPFLERAGERSALLRPGSWSAETHPLLALDPLRPGSFSAAGIATDAPATWSFGAGARTVCTALKDVKTFQRQAQERLSVLGEPFQGKASGAELRGATVSGRLVAGYVLKGNEACAANHATNAEPFLRSAARQLGHATLRPGWKGTLGLPGVAYVFTLGGGFALRGTDITLTVESRASTSPLALRPAASSPYGAVPPSGLLFARLHAEPRAVMDTGRQFLTQACPHCAGAELEALSHFLAAHITGQVLLRVDRVKVEQSLVSAAGRFAALKQALLLELTQADEVRRQLKTLAPAAGAQADGEDWVLTTPGGTLRAGVRGNHLLLGNDVEALRALEAAAQGKAGKLAHSAELVLDPRLTARALEQISLLDVLGSKELAGLFALSSQVGPLLQASERVSAWMDTGPGNQSHASLTWALPMTEGKSTP